MIRAETVNGASMKVQVLLARSCAVLCAVGLLAAASLVHAAPPIRLALIEGMSGPFGNAGAMVERNLRFAIDRVNARGGVKLRDGAHPLELTVFDSKGAVEESLVQLKAAGDLGIPFVLQGNSSAVASALIDAVNKRNAREPGQRMLFFNYSAVDTALTNEQCSFWHFAFDANAAMRMQALTEAIKDDASIQKVYLLNQDYSFGRQVAGLSRQMIGAKRPDVQIVGEQFSPVGRVKDFTPYLARIRASGADTVVTGSWGNDLTLLVKAAREQGMELKFYTFYGNALGAPAALGEAGVGRVYAVAEWHPNVGGEASDAFYKAFRARYPEARDDYALLRMSVMIDMIAAALEQAGTTDVTMVARALENRRVREAPADAWMRPNDHQMIEPLYVSVMRRAGEPGVKFDNEGSGFGFKTVMELPASKVSLPSTCRMARQR
ncbi:Leucine-, isoleucine-, valine-, threonine-, and alanine-binding protein [Pandoraea communis]|uniref:Leucine-, isoleucine-, valine-, threonine-, and alanine-binding protein n=2 Tax=Pandoraea communis TaxID=2508297 RepID=A0A5E4SV19_9BURK|nr:Leucine-, isoleucine-, valine-, threonine-, and alanine-binding protein [Pandoraea communis]